MVEYISKLMENFELSENLNNIISEILVVVIIFIITYLVYVILTKVVVSIVSKYTIKSKNKFDDVLLNRKMYRKFSNLTVSILVYNIIGSSGISYSENIKFVIMLYIISLITYIMIYILTCLNDMYNTFEISKSRPIKGIIQVVQIVIFIFGAIILIAKLLNQDPIIIISGLGALSAVGMLVFKDSLLGLVAGIQIAVNNMVKINDSISIPSEEIVGTIIDISLTTVTIESFDKSITTIPTYDLVSKPFSNFKGMVDSNVRRMKKTIYIDINSIDFLTDKDIERFKNVNFLRDYILSKEKELKEYNDIHRANNDEVINLRKLTNLGTFRVYINNYLKYNENISDDLTVLVSQLEHSEKGIPIDIYAFVNTGDWGKSELIQTEIFEHIYSIAKEFGINFTQNPTGKDFERVK